MSQAFLAEHSILSSPPYPSPYWSFWPLKCVFPCSLPCKFSSLTEVSVLPYWGLFYFIDSHGNRSECSVATITTALHTLLHTVCISGRGVSLMWSYKLYLGCKCRLIKHTKVWQFCRGESRDLSPVPSFIYQSRWAGRTTSFASQKAHFTPLCGFPTISSQFLSAPASPNRYLTFFPGF